jgi:hypothetical protein
MYAGLHTDHRDESARKPVAMAADSQNAHVLMHLPEVKEYAGQLKAQPCSELEKNPGACAKVILNC